MLFGYRIISSFNLLLLGWLSGWFAFVVTTTLLFVLHHLHRFVSWALACQRHHTSALSYIFRCAVVRLSATLSKLCLTFASCPFVKLLFFTCDALRGFFCLLGFCLDVAAWFILTPPFVFAGCEYRTGLMDKRSKRTQTASL